MRKAILKRRTIKDTLRKTDFKKNFEGLQSTKFAETLVAGRDEKVGEVTQPFDYQVNPIYTSADVQVQMYEIRGKCLSQANYKYHTPLYQDLLSKVVPLRLSFRKEQDNNARKEIAKLEFDSWNSYLEARKYEITQLKDIKEKQEENIEHFEAHKETALHFKHQIQEGDLFKLRELFDRQKDRKTHKMKASQLTTFHGEYSKKYQFPVPLHPKNLSQITHPFQGYLQAFGDDKQFNFEELHTIYLNQIGASYEKTFGRVLLGEELSCLSFWLIQDEAQKGWLSLEELRKLLHALKFQYLFIDEYGKPDEELTVKKLKQEFKFNLGTKKGEILEMPNESETIIRFDFIRDIFLERGL